MARLQSEMLFSMACYDYNARESIEFLLLSLFKLKQALISFQFCFSRNMLHFTAEDCSFCAIEYFRNGQSATIARRLFATARSRKNLRGCPGLSTIKRWAVNFKTFATAYRPRPPTHYKPVRTQEAIATVSRVVKENPRLPTRRIAAAAGLKPSSTLRILKKDLKMRCYRPTIVQQLLPGDPPQRLHFANEMFRLFDNFDNIIFSDEAHFTLEATINTRNTVFWDTSNPQIIQECPLHPQKVTVWAGLASWVLVGPFFFEEIVNDEPVTVTINSDRYGELLRDSLMPALGYMEGFDEETWFQQDGAPPHTALRIMAYLRELFSCHLISKRELLFVGLLKGQSLC